MAENKPPNPQFLILMEKAEECLDAAQQAAAVGTQEQFDRQIKLAETYRDFSAMFRGQGF